MLDLGGGHTHVGFGPHANLGGPAFAIEIEHNPLTLAKDTKNRTFECVGGQHHVAAVDVGHHDAFAGERIEDLDDALHSRPQPFLMTLPALMHDVHAWTRLGVPFTIARTFWIFGSQRRLFRRWEWETRMPKFGFFPQTSQTAAMSKYLIEPNVNRRNLPVAAPCPRIGQGNAIVAQMSTLARLGPAEVRRVIEAFRDALRSHQEELNRLNVYPVPDGDTGTNMALTLESVCTELRTTESMGEVCTAIARGSLMGARGNSGVITSQILRGMVEVFGAGEVVEAGDVVRAMRRAADAAYEAVMRPVEGTILTVVRETAEGLEALASSGRSEPLTLAEVLQCAQSSAHASVLRTPDLLPALRDAGVVDSGGSGFTLLIAALRHVAEGIDLPEPSLDAPTPMAVERHLSGDDVASLRYEVMFLLDAPDDAAIPAFRAAWMAVGDSIVVVGSDGLYNCHIHTNDIGAAVEAGIQAGRPNKIRVTDLFEEVAAEEQQWVREATGDHTDSEPVETAVVAVAVGEGLRRLLVSLGVQSIIAGGQSMNPSTAQILEAVEAANAQSVIVLPNNKNIIPVARQVDSLTAKSVEVVPTTSVVEALAALISYDPEEEIALNVASFSEALTRVRAGEVTQAVRDSRAECGEIAVGDWLAIARDGGIIAARATTAEACASLLDFLVDDDSEIVTVLVGADARTTDSQRIREHLKLAHPQVEVEFHEGGQPLYPYLVGVE